MGRPRKSSDDLVSMSLRLPSMLKARIDSERGDQSATDWIVDAIRGKLDGQLQVSAEQRIEDQLLHAPITDLKPAGFGLDPAVFLSKLKPVPALLENLPLDEPEDPQEDWYHKCCDQFPQQTKQAEIQSKQHKGKDAWGRMDWGQRYERLRAFREAGDSGQA
jgi:hypothetical protein